MKPSMLPPFHEIFNFIKPKTVCEIGTHDGKSAVQFIDYCITLNPKLKYYGYDVFDAVANNEEFHKREINGKGAGNYRRARRSLLHRQGKYKQFEFKLYKGFTQDTLKETTYDFVYIDGGHSYETVKHDYYKVKDSKIIVFDDYQTEGVKQFFDELVIKENLQQLDFKDCFFSKSKCWAFMPHGSTKHIQPVIFNKEIRNV